MRDTGKTIALRAPAVLLFLALAGCASFPLRNTAAPATLNVAPSDRLFLAVAPFDSTVRAELARGGLDPARVEEEFNAELRYQFALRRQEEARDSAGAVVRLRVEVRHLQPGTGNAGTFAAFALAARRDKGTENVEWSWFPRAKDNVPEAHAARHLPRAAAAEVLARVKAAPPRSKEPPPPLILLQ